MTTKHPYVEFEATQTWAALDAAISELVANDDLKEKTARQYIVGFLCKALAEKGIK